MTQEPVLFSLSVAENIAYGLPNDHVSKDDIIKAAKAANAHEFIISLPQVRIPYLFFLQMKLISSYQYRYLLIGIRYTGG